MYYVCELQYDRINPRHLCRLMFIFASVGLGVNVLLLLTIGHEHPPGQECGHDHGGCNHVHGNHEHNHVHGSHEHNHVHGNHEHDPVMQVLSEARRLTGVLHVPDALSGQCLVMRSTVPSRLACNCECNHPPEAQLGSLLHTCVECCEMCM
jgi:hypothetical protein